MTLLMRKCVQVIPIKQRPNVMSRFFLSVIVGLWLICLGCHKSQANYNQTLTHKIYSQNDLENLIQTGMDSSNVIARFGYPQATMWINSHLLVETYIFPLELTRTEKGMHLDGFSVYIKSGKVARWSPIDTESFKMSQSDESHPLISFGECRFELFIETDGLSNALASVDSVGSVDTRNILAPPNLVIKAQVYVDESSPTNRNVFLTLRNQDVPKLKDLTERNFGKRMLIVYNDKGIAAPRIAVPLASSKFSFLISDTNVFSHFHY